LGSFITDSHYKEFISTLKSKIQSSQIKAAVSINRELLNLYWEIAQGISNFQTQHKLKVGGDEFYIDLLFYHTKLHCYIVIELKSVKFKPEFAGKLNFYLSAVDEIIKTDKDNPTIGILICKDKNDTVVEYALKNIEKPIGVSEYTITQSLPKELKSALPTIEEIENEILDDLS
jgi:hypothetical protein